jgi:hypothetical protein
MLAKGRAAAQQLVDVAVPRLAGRLGESPEQLQAGIAADYPDVAAGLQRLPAIIATTGTALTNLQRHHQDFVDADSFPGSGVSRPAAAVGGIALARPRMWPLPAILVLAGAGAALPLVASLPRKAQGVRAMVGALNLSTATATATRQNLVVVERFHDHLLERLVPDAAAHLGTTADELVADIGSGLDTLQAALKEYRRPGGLPSRRWAARTRRRRLPAPRGHSRRGADLGAHRRIGGSGAAIGGRPQAVRRRSTTATRCAWPTTRPAAPSTCPRRRSTSSAPRRTSATAPPPASDLRGEEEPLGSSSPADAAEAQPMKTVASRAPVPRSGTLSTADEPQPPPPASLMST